MSTAAWAIVAAAALCVGFAAPRARRSRPALAIAVTGACIVLAGLVFGAAGYGGCSDRGDCGALGDALRAVLTAGVLVLPVLLLVAASSWVWRRVRPAGDRSSRPIRLRDGALAAVGGLSLLVSIAMLAGAGEQSRIASVICFLFSLALLSLPVSHLLPVMPPRLDRVDVDGVAMPAVVVDGSRGKLRVMRGALVLFAAVGVLMAVAPGAIADPGEDGRARLIGIVCATVFGTVLVISLFTSGRFRLVLVQEGLRWEAGASPASVAWDDVAGVSLTSMSGTHFLGVDLVSPDALKTTSTQRRIARFSRPIAGADVSIALETFPVDPERLVDTIAAYADEPDLRREIGTERSLARLTSSQQPAMAG